MSKIRVSAQLDLTTLNDWVDVQVHHYDAVRAGLRTVSGSWGSAQVVLEVAVDGQAYVATSPATTFTANGASAELGLTSLARVRARVATADAAAGTVEAVFVLHAARYVEWEDFWLSEFAGSS